MKFAILASLIAFFALSLNVDAQKPQRRQSKTSQSKQKTEPPPTTQTEQKPKSAPQKQDLNQELLRQINKGDIALVKSLLAKGADANVKDNNGLTALMVASLYGQADVAQALIEKGADINARHSEPVRVPLTTQGSGSDLTPLMFAAIMGHSNVVDVLLDKGANVNAKVGDLTAYLLAVIGRPNMTKDQKAIAEKLYARESVAGDVTKQKVAAMFSIERCHWAGYEDASLTRAEMINIFSQTFGIARSIDVTIYNLGITDMWTAAGKGDIATLQTLLANGANVNEKGLCGITPLIVAAEVGNAEVIQFLLDKGWVKSNILTKKLTITDDFEKGADINVQDSKNGWTALMTAANHGKVEVVKLLIAKGADLNLKARDNRTALAIASRNNEIVKLLKEAGAKEQ